MNPLSAIGGAGQAQQGQLTVNTQDPNDVQQKYAMLGQMLNGGAQGQDPSASSSSDSSGGLDLSA